MLYFKIFRNYPRYQSLSALVSYSTFNGVIDRYNGITVDTKTEICEEKHLAAKLNESINKWKNESMRCLWFKINVKDSFYVPVLAKNGFKFHHAREDFVMMYRWLPEDSTANLPPSPHIGLAVGGMVFNKASKILAVSEPYYNYPHWKLPGGHVDRGENLVDAAIREVKEETGIDSEFYSVATIRHTHNMQFGNSDIFAMIMLNAINEEIKISPREVIDCKWMDIEEFTNHPHVHSVNKFIVKKALEYKEKNIRLEFKKETVKLPNFVRETHYLSIEGI